MAVIVDFDMGPTATPYNFEFKLARGERIESCCTINECCVPTEQTKATKKIKDFLCVPKREMNVLGTI